MKKNNSLLAAASYASGFTIFLQCTGTIIEKLPKESNDACLKTQLYHSVTGNWKRMIYRIQECRSVKIPIIAQSSCKFFFCQ